MAQESHEDQHWIPRSYTKAWTDKSLPQKLGKRVHIYKPDGIYIGWRYPPQLFSKPNFYIVTDSLGRRDLRIEKMLGRIESDFARVRRSILEKQRPIDDKHRATLALFVAALRTRTPSSHAHISGFWNEVVGVGDRMAAQMAAATPERRKQLARSFTSPLGGDREKSISQEEARTIANMKPGETLLAQLQVEAPLLAKLNIAVLTTECELGFITSDRPVVWWDPSQKGGRDRLFGLGLGNRDIEITVPILPRQCLLFSHNHGASDYTVATSDARDVVNLRTLAYCEEMWLSDRRNLEVDWLSTSEST